MNWIVNRTMMFPKFITKQLLKIAAQDFQKYEKFLQKVAKERRSQDMNLKRDFLDFLLESDPNASIGKIKSSIYGLLYAG